MKHTRLTFNFVAGRCDDGVYGTGKCILVPSKNQSAFKYCDITLKKHCSIELSDIPGDLLLTTVFNSKADPQRRHVVLNCAVQDTKYYQSIRKLGVSVLIFHDCLESDAVLRLQTNFIRFYKVTLSNYSLNDERFMLYYSFLTGQDLSKYPAYSFDTTWNVKLQHVLMTDFSDVVINRNPFEIMFGTKYSIYVGDQGYKWDHFFFKKTSLCNLNTKYAVSRNMMTNIFNAGLIGGSLIPVNTLLRQMILFLLQALKDGVYDCNMVALNKCLDDIFPKSKLYYGYPLHNQFHRKVAAHRHAYIYHKYCHGENGSCKHWGNNTPLAI